MATARKVCIIDDDESVGRALRRLVRSAGLDADAFASAEEFLESIDPADVGCLILDVTLPGMSGLELQERLTSAGRHIPTIIITSFASDPVHSRAMSGGAVAFLHKPLHEKLLLGAVLRVVGD
jgi:FixJ family two-component response regulator